MPTFSVIDAPQIPSDICALQDLFLQFLNRRTFDRCDEIIMQIHTRERSDPALTPYRLYFSATLLDERENNWAAAKQLYSEVLTYTPLPKQLQCDALQSVSLLMTKQGLWADALDNSHKAVALASELNSLDMQHKILVGQAIIYLLGFNAGDFGLSELTRAKSCCTDALACLTTQEKKPSRAAGAWSTLGHIYRELSRVDDAISCYQNLLQIGCSTDNAFYMAHASNNLGVCYLHRRQWPDAIEVHSKALELFQNDYNRLDVYANLGYLYQNIGDFEQAIKNYDLALALIDDVRAGQSADDARINFATTVSDVYANAVLTCDAASKVKNVPEQEKEAYKRRAFDYMEQARSRTFLDLLHSDSLELKPDFRAEPLTLDQVQASLPEDALMLCYFTTGTIESSDARAQSGEYRRHRFPEARIIALAVTKHEIHSHTSMLSPNVLYPQDKFGDIIRDHFLAEGVLRTLYSNLLKPFEGLLADRCVLYIVPHGPLHYVPFQAMLTDDGQTLLNRHGPRIVYAPSASVLLRERSGDESVTADTEEGVELKSCLAIGYNGSGEDRLLLAEDEANTVATLTRGQSIVGPQTKKELLFELAPTFRSLYFACHGKFDVNYPLKSALWIGDDEWLTAAEALEKLEIGQCDLVILNACQTGLNYIQRGDELFGLMRAFMLAGASMLILTHWKVDEWSTRIIIEEFCRQVDSGSIAVEALHQSQLYLQELTRDEIIELLSGDEGEFAQEIDTYLDRLRADYAPHDPVFADPFHWAPFVLICESLNRERA